MFFILRNVRHKKAYYALHLQQAEKDMVIANLREENHKKNVETLKQNINYPATMQKIIKEYDMGGKMIEERKILDYTLNANTINVLQKYVNNKLTNKD